MTSRPTRSLFEGYEGLAGAFDELFHADARPRREAARVVSLLDGMGAAEFRARKRISDLMFRDSGVTFSVYADGRGVERIFPFDPIPRVIGAAEWNRLARGLAQRLSALNLYLADVYGAQRILDAGIVPRDMLEASRGYLPQVRGIRPPGGTYVHVAGIDLIRRADGAFVVLEDNLRTPSGISYVLENRAMMKRVYPHIFRRASVQPVDEYPTRLREALESLAPADADAPRTVVLTPGPYNSAYFEHCFLARRMGVELVEARDLFVSDDRVFVKTTRGPVRVHVIYRRIDDQYIDPEVFRPDSMLGVPGLMRAYRAGHVTLANAVGNGAADDKAIYPYVPDMIRFYL
ncbi:MAG TPA: circularly permuted type 2 ATP-grasp protein, partial [Gemmatimonadales bacterium]|nr:circularly permuted type 2 ATP-grasp protein [Gemmatimonadales bacterium]